MISGQWETEGDTYRQTAPDPADYVLNTGLYAANYQVEADVRPSSRIFGAGFMVHMLERGRKNGATVVRFTDGGDGLFWGVYDAAGVFVGRGSVDWPTRERATTSITWRWRCAATRSTSGWTTR